MTTKDDQIKAIYEGLNAGTSYVTKQSLQMDIKNYVTGEHRYLIPWTCLWINEEYIFYRHHGESAVKNTLEDLTWVLEHIFDDTDINDILPETLQTLKDTMNEGQGSWTYRGEYDRHIIGREI